MQFTTTATKHDKKRTRHTIIDVSCCTVVADDHAAAAAAAAENGLAFPSVSQEKKQQPVRYEPELKGGQQQKHPP